MKILMNLKKRLWSSFVNDIRPVAALLTIISVLVCISTEDPINRDGILYIKTAQTFLNSGMADVLKLYKWPFYPILLATTSKYLFISLETAVYLWNVVFTITLVIAFMSIIKEISPSRLLQIFSMIIIIGHPKLHHYEKYVIRDLGYWAFLMLSLYYVVRYCHANGWRHLISGWTCLYIASLFRIEGIIFILLYPLILLVKEEPITKRIKKTLTLYTLFGILSMIALFCHIKGINIYASTRLSEINIYLRYFHDVTAKLHHKAGIAGNAILAKPAKKWGFLFVFFGLTGILVYKFIMTLWPVHFLLGLYSIVKRIIPADRAIIAIYAFLGISILIPALFLYQNLFLSYRFLMPTSIITLLFTPFALEKIYNNTSQDTRRLIRVCYSLLILFFIVLFIGAFMPPKHTKAYIRNAGLWIKCNLPKGSKIYANAYVPELSYYSGYKIKKIGSPGQKIAIGSYMIFSRATKKNIDSCTGNTKLLTVFSNDEGKRIYIFECE